MEDWVEARRLHRVEGLPIKAIVRRLGISRNSVRRAFASQGPPQYSQRLRGSSVDVFEPRIRALLAEFPGSLPSAICGSRRSISPGATA